MWRARAAVSDPVRFHLDEHMPRALARALRDKNVDVTTTPEVGLPEADDEEHLAFAMRERRVIDTDDTDFLRLAATFHDHAGIAYCDRMALTLGQIIDGLLLIHGVLTTGEFVAHIEYL